MSADMGRVDGLHPGGVLLAEVFEQLQPGAHLQHLRRRDPRLGQPAVGQQLPQQLGVGPVGLRPTLRSTRSGGIGGSATCASTPRAAGAA
jgi:hypothetical protein